MSPCRIRLDLAAPTARWCSAASSAARSLRQIRRNACSSKNFESDGWEVREVNGHQFQEIYTAFREATLSKHPTAIIAHTTMGKGVSFMEGKEEFHGRALTLEEYKKAIQELGVEDDLDRYRQIREKGTLPFVGRKYPVETPSVRTGNPRNYEKDQETSS